MEREPTDKNLRGISQTVKDRVVELSLLQPDHGARRLVPLLNEEEISISESSVYTILRGRGLQTRSLRLAKLAERQAAAEPTPIKTSAEISKKAPVLPVSPRVSPQTKAFAKPRAKTTWFFHVLNALLIFAIVCLGEQLLQYGQSNGLEADAAAVTSTPARLATQPEAFVRPLAEYRGIWERNLFGTAEPEPAAAAKPIPIAKLSPANPGLGLKLMGTAVADNPGSSMAVIDDHSTGEQKIFHEGDRVGDVRIKKILRDRVIITTAQGDALLAANSSDSGRGARSAPPAQATDAKRLPPVNSDSLGSRPEVETSPFADITTLMAQVRISPYIQNDQASGVRIAAIGSQSPLTRLRLRNGDVITGVNGEKITTPDEATRFFEQLAEGGDITLQVIRRRRPKLIHLNFN